MTLQYVYSPQSPGRRTGRDNTVKHLAQPTGCTLCYNGGQKTECCDPFSRRVVCVFTFQLSKTTGAVCVSVEAGIVSAVGNLQKQEG